MTTGQDKLAAARAEVGRASNAHDAAEEEVAAIQRLLTAAEERERAYFTALEIARSARDNAAVEAHNPGGAGY